MNIVLRIFRILRIFQNFIKILYIEINMHNIDYMRSYYLKLSFPRNRALLSFFEDFDLDLLI